MRIVLGLLFVLCLPGLAQAQPFADPLDVLAALYAGYDVADSAPAIPQRELQSDRLNALIEKDANEASGQSGRIQFDPYVNGQDFDITDVELREPYYAGGRAMVHVQLRNFGAPQNLGFMLVNENGGWKIDNVWGVAEDHGYDLLDILQQPMP